MKASQLNELYEVTIGQYKDKYMVVSRSATGQTNLRRIRTPKTKIDGVRLPENITISYFGSQVSNEPKTKK